MMTTATQQNHKSLTMEEKLAIWRQEKKRKEQQAAVGGTMSASTPSTAMVQRRKTKGSLAITGTQHKTPLSRTSSTGRSRTPAGRSSRLCRSNHSSGRQLSSSTGRAQRPRSATRLREVPQNQHGAALRDNNNTSNNNTTSKRNLTRKLPKSYIPKNKTIGAENDDNDHVNDIHNNDGNDADDSASTDRTVLEGLTVDVTVLDRPTLSPLSCSVQMSPPKKQQQHQRPSWKRHDDRRRSMLPSRAASHIGVEPTGWSGSNSRRTRTSNAMSKSPTRRGSKSPPRGGLSRSAHSRTTNNQITHNGNRRKSAAFLPSQSKGLLDSVSPFPWEERRHGKSDGDIGVGGPGSDDETIDNDKDLNEGKHYNEENLNKPLEKTEYDDVDKQKEERGVMVPSSAGFADTAIIRHELREDTLDSPPPPLLQQQQQDNLTLQTQPQQEQQHCTSQGLTLLQQSPGSAFMRVRKTLDLVVHLEQEPPQSSQAMNPRDSIVPSLPFPDDNNDSTADCDNGIECDDRYGHDEDDSSDDDITLESAMFLPEPVKFGTQTILEPVREQTKPNPTGNKNVEAMGINNSNRNNRPTKVVIDEAMADRIKELMLENASLKSKVAEMQKPAESRLTPFQKLFEEVSTTQFAIMAPACFFGFVSVCSHGSSLNRFTYVYSQLSILSGCSSCSCGCCIGDSSLNWCWAWFRMCLLGSPHVFNSSVCFFSLDSTATHFAIEAGVVHDTKGSIREEDERSR